MTTRKFKHSGALGDLIYSLPLVKHFGGGDFYLHLNQMDWIGQHYYGALPSPFHQGRMTEADYEYMRSFMNAQEYITAFDILDPRTAEITHNLDRFRVPFVGHPDNYINIYCQVFGLDTKQQNHCASTPWLTVPRKEDLAGRDVVINRTERWIPNTMDPAWQDLKTQGLADRAVFVGLEREYLKFKEDTGWDIPWRATQTMLELAEVIAGADVFVGNQSQCLALAIGLGVEEIWCEARRDMPLDRNECYFPLMENVNYF